MEIVKALYRDARILILDEPTAVLTPQEADELFVVLRELVAQGTSVIFISHKLREVLSIADRIVVLRRGEVVGEAKPARGHTTIAGRDDGRSRRDSAGRQAGTRGR